MDVDLVDPADGSLLRAVRRTLSESDEVVLAVAYVKEAGAHLLAKELQALGPRARLVSTTAFGSTSREALARVWRGGARLRLHNPAGRSYHPKLYLGRDAQGRAQAVIGSANLTGGLVSNVELATWMRGRADEGALGAAWRWAEALWARPDLQDYAPGALAAEALEAGEQLPAGLLAALRAAVAEDPVFMTLGASPRPNTVTELTPRGLWVHTARTKKAGQGPAFVPAWMFLLAWETLRQRGELSSTHLLNELRVHRSSAVCAVLARLPGVAVRRSRPITLGWEGGLSWDA